MQQNPSQDESLKLSGARIDEAEDNLARCLEALDREGEAGLQRELLRIHPDHPQPMRYGLQPRGSLIAHISPPANPDSDR